MAGMASRLTAGDADSAAKEADQCNGKRRLYASAFRTSTARDGSEAAKDKGGGGSDDDANCLDLRVSRNVDTASV